MEHINCKEEVNITVSGASAAYTFTEPYDEIPKVLIDTYIGDGQVGDPVVTTADVTFPVTNGDGDSMSICVIKVK